MPDFESLIQAFPFPVALLDKEGRLTIVNDAWDRFGRKSLAPDLFGLQQTEYFATCRRAAAEGWEVAARLISGLREVSAGAESSCSLEYRCTDGDIEQWFRLTASSLPEANVLVIQNDITVARHASSHLQRLTAAVSAAANAIVVADREGVIEWANPAFTRLTGYTEAEARGRHTRLLEPGQLSDSFYQDMWRTILAGNTWEGTLINQQKDGTLYHEHMSITPIKNASGFVTHFIAIKQDVSESVRKEKVLREERAFLKSIVDHIPIQIFVKDATELRYVRVNSALERQLGYTREEMIGKTDYDFWPEEQADFFIQKDREVLRSGKHVDIPEEPISTEDGATRWLHTQKIPILAQDGKPAYLLGISEDITERKRQERELIEAKERAESADELKTTLLHQLDHEMRTPLTSIIGFAEDLIEQGEAGQVEQARFIYQSGLQLLKLFESATEASDLVGGSDAAVVDVLEGTGTLVPSPSSSQDTHDHDTVADSLGGATRREEAVRRRLLIVEDNYITRRLMERALSGTFDVVPTESFSQALASITSGRFDACLFDIDLDEGHTGIELLYEMRDVPGYERVPVIACTAHVMDGARERFMSVGFQGYIAKPFTKKRLEEALEAVFEADIASTKNTANLDVTLPAPPTMLVQTVRLLNASSKEADIESLTRLVDQDPIAAAWVLRHVNSGYFSLSRRVVRIDHAVKLLGFKPVCNLLLGGVLSHAFADKDDPDLKKVHEYIQSLSVTTAAVARHLAGAVGIPKEEQETIFTGSLLHQLGRMIMLSKYGKAYADLWRVRDSTAQWSQLVEPTRGREFLAFETNYVRLGTQAARVWQLGEPICTMIGAQQYPHTLGDMGMQKYVLLMVLSRVAATTLVDGASAFPACFSGEPSRRWLGDLAALLDLALEALLDHIEQALDSTKAIVR